MQYIFYFALSRINICFVSRKCISLRNSRHQEVSSDLHSKLPVKCYMELQWHGFVVLLYSTRYHSDNDTALLKSWVIIIMSFKIRFKTFVQDFTHIVTTIHSESFIQIYLSKVDINCQTRPTLNDYSEHLLNSNLSFECWHVFIAFVNNMPYRR